MVYVILGQTASGKTGLACKLARELNLPLIGADAFQVYKELNIGSAKPTKQELEGITYHLIGFTSINEEMNVKVYQEQCRKLIESYQSQNKDVILSGGTFLYVKSVLYPYEFSSEEPVEDELDNLSKEELLSILEKEDEKTYEVIDKNNLRRVIRAIRMARNGVKRSEVTSIVQKPLCPCKFFAINQDVAEGNEKIANRVEQMLSSGLIEEVKGLMSSYNPNLTAFQAIGYKEVIKGLKENQSLEQIKENIIIDTRQYAKRQRTFLRHQFENISFLSKEEIYSYVTYDFNRRKRNKISIQPQLLSKIEKANVTLVGLGGVGSIVASGLVRLGVSNLTIIDKDVVDVSNLNRQLLYTKSDVGNRKVLACKEHLLSVDPLMNINPIDDFYSDEYISQKTDFIIDCIDDVKSKAKLIINAVNKKIPFISATGSGLRKDSTKYKFGNISMTGEPLAKAVKKELTALGFADFEKVNVCYSSEVPIKRIAEEIGSNFISPNGEGLAILSYFLFLLGQDTSD